MTQPPRPIYLDHNASTPLLPEVLDAMLPFLSDHFGNPSSPHPYGRRMRDAVEHAREQVAVLIDAAPGEVFFTSGGTEANNLAIRGTARANPERRSLVTSVIEHPATSGPCGLLERSGYSVIRVGVDGHGQVDPGEVGRACNDDTLLVTVMHANSETGTLQPIRRIARTARDRGALIHTDAAQSAGKVTLSVRHEEADLLSIAGHKLYAPQGVGALYIREGTAVEPLLIGGGHEQGLRPGTENVASIVGLGRACALAQSDLEREGRRVSGLRDSLWERLSACVPELGLNGDPVNRLPNTLNVRFPGVTGQALLEACPGVAASTGSACHEGEASASPVILAMGIPEEEAVGSVRLTLGRGTSALDIEHAAGEMIRAWQELVRDQGP